MQREGAQIEVFPLALLSMHLEFTLLDIKRSPPISGTIRSPQKRWGKRRSKRRVLFRWTMPLFQLHWSGMPDFTARCPPPSVEQSASSEPVAFRASSHPYPPSFCTSTTPDLLLQPQPTFSVPHTVTSMTKLSLSQHPNLIVTAWSSFTPVYVYGVCRLPWCHGMFGYLFFFVFFLQ